MGFRRLKENDFNSWLFAAIAAAVFLGCFVYVASCIKYQNKNCSDSQLHEVIQSVDECNKKNVICNEKMKDEIISKVCK